MDILDYSGRVALVTGGANPGGIGYAAAKVFASHGATVIVADKDLECAQAAARGLRAMGVESEAVFMDTREAVSVNEGIAWIVEKYSKIDFCLQIAGGNAMRM